MTDIFKDYLSAESIEDRYPGTGLRGAGGTGRG